MTTSPPIYGTIRRRARSRLLIATSLAFAAIVGVGALSGLPIVGADPASGEGPITVDDGGHWFEYADNGEPYFMAGAGGPEGFLYYSDSRKQEIVDQLIDNDVRAIYIHAVRSNGGDGGSNENPFNGSNPDSGVDPDVLDEWDAYLSQLDDAGIVTWFHLYDDGARPFGACNPDLPAAEKEFVKTIVERFRDYQHLVWLPTEEHIIKACPNNSVDVEKAEALAAEIREHDDVHPLGVHHNNGQSNQYLGNDDIDVFAQQICQQSQFASVDGIHDAGEFGEDVYVMAECHPWHKELLDAGQRTTLRRSFWSSVMAGGYVLFYDAWESNDPTDEMLADLGRINAFMDTTRFAETAPADQLAAAGTKWVLGNESSDVYVAYSNTNPSSMGIQGMTAGTYDLGWFDPVTGQRVTQTVAVDDGTATFPVPGQIGAEVALSVEPADGTPPPTTTPPTTTPPTTTPPTTAPPTTTPPTTTVPPTTTPPITTPPPTTPPVGPTLLELTATEDAFLEGSKRVDGDQLRVEHGSRNRTSYVRFDTSGLDVADGVRFTLTVGSDAGAGTVSVWRGEGGTWTSDTLTPANAPVPGELLGSVSGSFSSGQELVVELPADIVAGGVLDLVITHDGSGSDDVSFDATETGDGPTLTVETSGAPPTTAPPTTTPPVTIPPEDVELAATEDAFLEGSKRVDSDQLRVEHGARTRTTYVRFDTSGVGVADTARLELIVGSDPGEGTVSVFEGEGGSWTSDTLTPANAPVAGRLLSAASGSFTPGQRLQFEVPSDAVAGDVLDLVIAHDGEGSDDVSFDATETGSGPALVVTSSTTTPSTTTPPTTTPPTTTPPTTTPPTTTPPTTTPPTTTPPTTTPPVDPGTDTVTFSGTDVAVPNPERGFHVGASVVDSTGGSNTSISQMTSFYDEGIRLARMYVRLDDYRNSTIPDALFDDLDQVFANARASGIKLIPRFSYNFGSAPDAPVDRIEQHIEQLTPVIRRNSDVIAVLQAGFIGAWGEWHSSSNDLTNPADRERVRDALLAALPTDRMAQFRYPDDIIEFEPTPLAGAEAFDGSVRSRTGHKNDCFLANEHDAGTYIPLSRKHEFVAYLSAMTEFTVMGGETCQVSAGAQRTDCATAVNELELFHWDYLNLEFYGNTIDKWRADGCFDEIDARLGYRYEMQSATASTQATPGGRLELDVDVVNAGFGKIYNPRPINVVLVSDSTGAVTRIERLDDARRVMPLPGASTTIDLDLDIPAGLLPGTYSVHLELPDGSPSLDDDPRYSIRMSNVGTWRAASGTNDLGLDVAVVSGPVGPEPDPDPDRPSVLFVRGADRSGGFLEAGSDAARTEQLADITNTSTNGGNHGWATFAGVLRREGFDVDQISEGAERSGPTDGRPVDFAGIDLDAYDLVVLGSNNAIYTGAQVDALDAYVRVGGAALFISDANFGGSWPDAPNSDQQFLDRYGIVVHQDYGTYVVDAGEYVTPGHPVLSGVSAFDGEGVSPFDVGGASIDVSVLARAEGNVRLNSGTGQGPTRQSGADDAAFWVADIGDGRIAGHYDRNTFFNANGAGTSIERLDNERYAVNLVTWLTTRGPATNG